MSINSLWEHVEVYDPRTVFCVQQDFPPDGVSIVVSIRQSQKGYEVWSSAEHRVSGPNDRLVAVKESFDEALKVAEAECYSWEEFFKKNSKE